MRVVCLLCDNLNRHFLKTYGSGHAETPNIRLPDLGALSVGDSLKIFA